MRKLLPFLVVGILVLSGLGAVASNIDEKEYNVKSQETMAFTHTVFAELGTATWCQYCHFAREALQKIYDSGDYPFYYVSLVGDKNSVAYSRLVTDYNLYGYPTVWFDGGYKVSVGGWTGAEAEYRSFIPQAGSRAVEDVDIELTVLWLGGTEMQIDASVKNNEDVTYGGRIRVYICEIESSRGWKDTAGHLYTFPFLDWAFNEVISIPSGDTWSDSMTWDGSDHGYLTVTPDNIMIIAAVFNDEPHTAYSYPPNQNPFTAYYVDETAAAIPIQNQPPNNPTITGPTSGKVGTSYDYNFVTTDPELEDVSYYIDWGDGTYSGWLGPYASGDQITQSHTWSEQGPYTIKCKAKDTNGAESGWGSLHITMPLNLKSSQQSSKLLYLKTLRSFLNLG